MSVPNDLSFSIFQKLVMTILGSPTLRFPLIPHHTLMTCILTNVRLWPAKYSKCDTFLQSGERGCKRTCCRTVFLKEDSVLRCSLKKGPTTEKYKHILCKPPTLQSIYFSPFSCSTSLIHLSAYLPPRMFWHLDTKYPKNTGITSGVLKPLSARNDLFFFDLPKNLSRLG